MYNIYAFAAKKAKPSLMINDELPVRKDYNNQYEKNNFYSSCNISKYF